MAQHQPRQFFGIRHRRRRHQLRHRRLRRAGHLHARFHIRFAQLRAFRLLAHGQHIERWVVVAAIEGNHAAVDGQLLAIGRILAAGHADGAVHARVAIAHHAHARTAGQVGVDAQAAQVEIVAQVRSQVDRERHFRFLLLRRGRCAAAQHDHVFGNRRAALRREFDQGAVGLEAAIERKTLGVAHQVRFARDDHRAVRTRQGFQLVRHQAQLHRAVGTEAHRAVGGGIALHAFQIQALQHQAVAFQLRPQLPVPQAHALFRPAHGKGVAVHGAVQRRRADGAAGRQVGLQAAVEFQVALAGERGQPGDRGHVGGCRHAQRAVGVDAPAQHLHGAVDAGTAGAGAVECHLRAQRAAGDVRAQIERAQAQGHRHVGADNRVAAFAEHVHAAGQGRSGAAIRNTHVERPVGAQRQIALHVFAQRRRELGDVVQRHAGRRAAAVPARTLLGERGDVDGAGREPDHGAVKGERFGRGQAGHAGARRHADLQWHRLGQGHRIAALVLQGGQGAVPGIPAPAAAHFDQGVEVVAAAGRAQGVRRARAARLQTGRGDARVAVGVIEHLDVAHQRVGAAAARAEIGAGAQRTHRVGAGELQVLAFQRGGERRCFHGPGQGAVAAQGAAEVGAEGGQLAGVDAPVELVASGAEAAFGCDHVRADVQVDVGVRDVAAVGVQARMAPERRLRQRRVFDFQVERAAPVGAGAAAGGKAAVDAARERAAKGGRVEAAHAAVRLDLDEARILAAGEPGFAAHAQLAVVRLALGRDPSEAIRIDLEGGARRPHRAGDDAAGVHRAIQIGAQGGELAAIEAPVEFFAGRAKGAVQIDLVLAEGDRRIHAAHVFRIGGEFAAPGQRLVEQAARAQGEVGVHFPLGRQHAGGVYVGIQVGLRIVAQRGRVEAAGVGFHVECLVVGQLGVAGDGDHALAGQQARFFDVDDVVFELGARGQAQAGVDQVQVQRLHVAGVGHGDVAGDFGRLHAAVDLLQIQAVGVQGEVGGADSLFIFAALHAAVAGKAAGAAQVDQHVGNLHRIQVAAQCAAHRAQRQALLVDGAGRAIIDQVDAAGDVALVVQAGLHHQVQVGGRQFGIEETGVDVLRVQIHAAQRDLGEGREGDARLAAGAPGRTGCVELGQVQVAAGVQFQLRRGGAAGWRAAQAGVGIELERTLGADAAVCCQLAPWRRGDGVAELPCHFIAMQAQADVRDFGIPALAHERGFRQARIVERDLEWRFERGRHGGRLFRLAQGFHAQIGGVELADLDAA